MWFIILFCFDAGFFFLDIKLCGYIYGFGLGDTIWPLWIFVALSAAISKCFLLDLFYSSHATNCQSTYWLVHLLNCHWGSLCDLLQSVVSSSVLVFIIYMYIRETVMQLTVSQVHLLTFMCVYVCRVPRSGLWLGGLSKAVWGWGSPAAMLSSSEFLFLLF